MFKSAALLPSLFALSLGGLLWGAISVLSLHREPWDDKAFWTFGYPISLLLSAILGYSFPEGSWRWPVLMMFMQIPVMMIAGSGLSLFPLGLLLIAVLSLPAVAAAVLASRILK